MRPLAVSAMSFLVVMGLVSLFSDMTYEGARSVYGAYLPLLGASGAAVGFVSGLGEFAGYGLRLITGILADRYRSYWLMTILGYGMNLVAIPLLALVPENGWMWACGLIILERTGKAIRQPAKNTLISFAAAQVGQGKSFALQECMDQVGACLGPCMLFGVLWFKDGDDPLRAYALCFALLLLPALLAVGCLLLARRRFPHPERFEPPSDKAPATPPTTAFLFYLAGISLLAVGFADFPLLTMHAARLGLTPDSALPLLYAGAMLVDAIAALFFGFLYDRKGFQALFWAGLLSAPFAFFAFCIPSLWSVLTGVVLWGIGMGAQESIFKAAVADLSPRASRSTSYGFFESVFGLFWFLGSWGMGALYDLHPAYLAALSVSAQALALPFFLLLARRTAASRRPVPHAE